MSKKGKAGAITNTRGLFSEAHDAGKGDKPRDIDKKKFDDNFEIIDWKGADGEDRKKLVVKSGKRTRIHYR
jgi:hypothetical protein